MRIVPGCLAVLRPSWDAPEEVGAIVSVLRKAGNGEKLTMRDSGSAECECDDAWLCDSRVTGAFPCFVRTRHLRRIDDGAEDEALTSNVGEPQAA